MPVRIKSPSILRDLSFGLVLLLVGLCFLCLFPLAMLHAQESVLSRSLPMTLAQANTSPEHRSGGFFSDLFEPAKPRQTAGRGVQPSAQPVRDTGGGLLRNLFGLGDRQPVEQQAPEYTGTYRTLCVRACDGYYYPVSNAATPAQFGHDAAQCHASCSSDARLYVYRNPGQDVPQMVDLSGRSYSALPNAYRYRKVYDSACRCKPDPWSDAAKAIYEARAKGGTSSQVAMADVAGGVPQNATPVPSIQRRSAEWNARANRPAGRRTASNDQPKHTGIFGFLFR